MQSLTAICRANGITLSALAVKVGRTRNTVKKWGRERRIPAEAVPDIVRALDGKISAHELRPDIFEAPRSRRRAA